MPRRPNLGGAVPFNPYGIGGGEDQNAGPEAYSQMPYEMIVDAMRGGSDLFAGPTRKLSKQEKLQAAVGAMTAFFGRMGTIGATPATRAQLGEVANEGVQQYQAAVSAPQRELQQSAFMQAAQARAKMEQEQLQQQQQEREFSRRMRAAELGAKIFPDLQPTSTPLSAELGGGPGVPEEVPQEARAAALQSGDFSGLMATPHWQPGSAARRQDERNYEQVMGLKRFEAESQAKDPLRLAQAKHYREMDEQDKEGRRQAEIARKSLHKEIDGAEKSSRDNPEEFVEKAKSILAAHGDKPLPEDAERRLVALLDIAEKQLAKRKAVPLANFRMSGAAAAKSPSSVRR